MRLVIKHNSTDEPIMLYCSALFRLIICLFFCSFVAFKSVDSFRLPENDSTNRPQKGTFFTNTEKIKPQIIHKLQTITIKLFPV